MRGRYPFAVVIAAVVLVLAVGSVGAMVRHGTEANAPAFSTSTLSDQDQGGHMPPIPPELQGLNNLPPAQRFDHFVGAQVNLKDKNNNPFTAYATPGKVTSASLSSLSITANDGTAQSYMLSDSTAIYGRPAQRGAKPTLSKGDLVVVVHFNDQNSAWAVIDGGPDGSGFGHMGGMHHAYSGR